MHCSVNLSGRQLQEADFVQRLREILQVTGYAADSLVLEITESLLIDHDPRVLASLRELADMGVRIALDDFGTGYSSLAYLKSFPVNSLKIDRTFISDVTGNPNDAAITTAIILMGHSMNLKVVAEGVETESQLAFLKVLQCNEVQGYFFSPPVPADRARELLLGEHAPLPARRAA